MTRDIQQLCSRIGSRDEESVYSATFIFRQKKEDEKFDRFNKLIDQAAKDNSGYLGKEGWQNPEEDLQSVVYYWDSLEALRTFSDHPDHQRAKRKYSTWYQGYEVIISEVVTIKADGGL